MNLVEPFRTLQHWARIDGIGRLDGNSWDLAGIGGIIRGIWPESAVLGGDLRDRWDLALHPAYQQQNWDTTSILIKIEHLLLFY